MFNILTRLLLHSFYVSEQEILYYENFNLTDVVMPINVNRFHELLIESNYDKNETELLTDGLSNGFSIGYQGPKNVKQTAPNLKFSWSG